MAKKTFWEMFEDVVDQVWLTNTFWDWLTETRRIKRDTNDIQKEILSLSKSYLNKAGILISWWTVAWQANYVIPDSVDKISLVKVTVDTEQYFPERVSIQKYNTFVNTESTSDIPSFFTVDKNEVYLYPVPETDSNPIELNANQKGTDLETDPASSTDSTTALEIKEWYENVIYYYLLSMAYMRLEDVWLADRFEWKHEKLLKRYKEEVWNPTNSIVVWWWRAGIQNPNNFTTLT